MSFRSWRSGVVGAVLGATVVALAVASIGIAQAAGGPLTLGSFISNGQCTPGTTNCTDFVTGVTSLSGGLTFRADGGTGLSGVSLSGAQGVSGQSQAVGGTGVSGVGAAYGVEGQGGSFGLYGHDSTVGVYAQGTDEGVHGFSGSGTGVAALSNSGTALSVSGKAEFSRSGRATITGTAATPKSSIQVNNVALTGKSLVLVTPQKSVAGVWVRAAVPNVANSRFTIFLNKAVTTSYPVGWMVIESP